MKKALFLSHSLITAIMREQCCDIASLFDNSLTPTTEQIEDLHEITRAWLADMPDSYQEKFNNGFSAGFEMAQQLTELDAEKEPVSGFSVTVNVDEDCQVGQVCKDAFDPFCGWTRDRLCIGHGEQSLGWARDTSLGGRYFVADNDEGAWFRASDSSSWVASSATIDELHSLPESRWANPMYVSEEADPKPAAKPEPEEDPFRHYLTSAEIPQKSFWSGRSSSPNSSGNSNSSNDSKAGDSNPTNLIDKPVEKNSQPYKERANLNKRRAEAAGLTTEHLLKAIETHGIDALASFCGITSTTAKAALSKAEVYGYPGPKCCDWLRSLKEAEPAEIAAPEKSEKLTEPQPQPRPEPQPEPKKTGPTQVISFGRARELCRTGQGTTDLERRFICAFNESGLDAATFIATLQELHGMAVIP